MRYMILTAFCAGTLAIMGATAQTPTTPPTIDGVTAPGKPLGLGPSKKLDVTNLVAPDDLERGNSVITESQARARIQATGFSSISGLAKDENGIWRAKAKLGNRDANVGLDRKGNVAAQ